MMELLRALRPHQWTKNVLVFAAAVFALRLNEPASVLRATLAFIIFCAASSAVYLFNDVRDRERDRLHPQKRHRPIAAGTVGTGTATVVCVILATTSLGAAFSLGPVELLWIIAGYLLLQLLYTLLLKAVAIVDALVVASGFVLRAVAGAVVIGAVVSPWLLICTIFFAVFVSLAKRRHEVRTLAVEANLHRGSLAGYDLPLLDQLIAIATAASLISYALYTTDPDTVTRFDTRALPLTLPFVIYAFFRFLYLTHRDEAIGDPARALLRDPPLLTSVLLWVLTVWLILYVR